MVGCRNWYFLPLAGLHFHGQRFGGRGSGRVLPFKAEHSRMPIRFCLDFLCDIVFD